MARSRIARALIATAAGLAGAGSVVSATLALTHAAHRSPRVASLALVSATDAPVGRGATGLLAWQPPSMPAALSLPPRVIEPVRVVLVTRRVTQRTTPAPRPKAHTATVRTVFAVAQKPGTQTTTTSTTRRTALHPTAVDDRTNRDDQHEGDEQHGDRQRDGSGEHERDDDE